MKRLVLPIVLAALLAGAAVYLYQSSRETAPATGGGVPGVPATGPWADGPRSALVSLTANTGTFTVELRA
jgi:hypothetical protein